MKKLFFVVILFSATLVFAQQANSGMDQDPATKPEPVNIFTPEVNLLYIINSQAAIMQEMPGNSGKYSLMLYNVKPYITYFTDRPARENGQASFNKFIDAWNVEPNSYKLNNPNAVLSAVGINNGINKGSVSYMLTLSDPTYDSKNSTLHFIASSFGKQKIILKEIKFDYVTIFLS